MPRLADLRPGDMVSYPNGKSGFTWVVLAVERVTRMLKWAPLACRAELQLNDHIVGRWSPPFDENEWEEELDIVVEDFKRHRNRLSIRRSVIANQDLV